MTTEQYLIALGKLGLTKVGASRVLGISPRQAQRIAAGEAEVPKPVAKLVQLMARHGVPVDMVERLT